MNFAKWLEYSDLGGEVSYNHMNNVVAQDSFNKIKSKYMTGHKKEKSIINYDKLFGKKTQKKDNNGKFF